MVHNDKLKFIGHSACHPSQLVQPTETSLPTSLPVLFLGALIYFGSLVVQVRKPGPKFQISSRERSTLKPLRFPSAPSETSSDLKYV